jgi:hypothetical protein
MAQRRHRAIGHRDRAIHAAFDLRQHVGPDGTRHMRSRSRLCPRAGVKSGCHGDRHQLVPSGVEFDFVDTMAVPVERAKKGRIPVGFETEPDSFGFAERLAERDQFGFGPTGVLARQRFAQYSVGLQEIVRLKRRRLVGNLIHRGAWSQFGKIRHIII